MTDNFLFIVVATHNFEARTELELSFLKGDVIEIVNTDNADSGWWLGRINGKEGNLPQNYVNKDFSVATALYSYTGAQAHELSFKKGQRIMVMKRGKSDWWEGFVDGQRGMFPVNYVNLDEDSSSTKQADTSAKPKPSQRRKPISTTSKPAGPRVGRRPKNRRLKPALTNSKVRKEAKPKPESKPKPKPKPKPEPEPKLEPKPDPEPDELEPNEPEPDEPPKIEKKKKLFGDPHGQQALIAQEALQRRLKKQRKREIEVTSVDERDDSQSEETEHTQAGPEPGSKSPQIEGQVDGHGECEEKYNHLAENLKASQNRVANLMKELEAAQRESDSLNNINKEAAQLKARNKDLNSSVHQLMTKVETMEARLKSVTSEKRDLHTSLVEAEGRVSELSDANAAKADILSSALKLTGTLTLQLSNGDTTALGGPRSWTLSLDEDVYE